MNVSIFLAKVLGLYFLIIGILMIVRIRSLEKIYQSFLEVPGLMILSGFLALTIGLLIVVSHNIWVMAWPLVITLLGWLSLLAGIVRIFFAGQPPAVFKRMAGNTGILIGALVFFSFIGAYLAYVGFSA